MQPEQGMLMGRVKKIAERTMIMLWIFTMIFALIFGFIRQDIGAFGLAGLTGMWLWFWWREER